MITVLAIIALALATLVVAWGREIDAEVARRVSIGERPASRPA